MASKYHIAWIGIIWLAFSCRSATPPEPVGRLETDSIRHLLNGGSRYNIITVFDAQCPGCFSGLFTFNENAPMIKDPSVPVYYIGLGNNDKLIREILSLADQQLNGHFILDSTFFLQRKNPELIKGPFSVFLTDSSQNILIIGDPFVNKEAKQKYKKLKLL